MNSYGLIISVDTECQGSSAQGGSIFTRRRQTGQQKAALQLRAAEADQKLSDNTEGMHCCCHLKTYKCTCSMQEVQTLG